MLGVDAGSTTTKAVGLDPATSRVVAAHYTRTRGDPVVAARECLHALAAQVGNRPVVLAATTGSARELVGAYLGTEHVFNEISAQAAGAIHFDADVDTIFEIGGQDAKYIHLRNGVPIDYAMNNACSAGTGSFLEESAQGDLGIAVADIADIALGGAGARAIQSHLRGLHQLGYPPGPAGRGARGKHCRRAGLCHCRQLSHQGQRPAAGWKKDRFCKAAWR